jgi:hypothetical protein
MFRIRFTREDFSPNGYKGSDFVINISPPHNRRAKALASICSRFYSILLKPKVILNLFQDLCGDW